MSTLSFLSLTSPWSGRRVDLVTTSPAVETDALDTCQTISEANATYKRVFAELYEKLGGLPAGTFNTLSEAHRRALERITQAMQGDAPRVPAPDQDRIRPRVIRNWCRLQGIGVPKKGRVPVAIENQYRQAKGLDPIPGGPPPPIDRHMVDEAAVRSWASSAGIPVGQRGRVPTDVIRAYLQNEQA